MTFRFDTWLDKHWLQALTQRGDCVFVHSRAGALLRAVLDDYCLQRNISPLRWRMTEHDALEPYSPPLLPCCSLAASQKNECFISAWMRYSFMAERTLLADYFTGRELMRIEFPLPDDLSFQSSRIRTLLIRLLSVLTQDDPQLLLSSPVSNLRAQQH